MARHEIEEAKRDLTPMIDVVFLLIIFFLCIDFRVLEAKLPAHLPKNAGTSRHDVPPIPVLRVQVICEAWGDEVPRGGRDEYRLVGHRVRWRVGPLDVPDATELARELKRVATDPESRYRDQETGEERMMRVVIEAGVGATYGDVAGTVDAVGGAGFDEITFGGGLAPRRRRG